MDLLKFLIGSRKSVDPCFLCFKNDRNNLDINTVFEIHNKTDVIYISLADMFKNLFPSEDFVLMQACNDCFHLISELYLLVHNRKSKILMLDCFINQLVVKCNATSEIPVSNNKLFLSLQVPSYQEHTTYNIDIIPKEDHGNHSSSELNYVSNEQTNLNTNAEVVRTCQYCSEKFLQIDEFKSHLKTHRKKQLRRQIHHYCNDCNYKSLSKTTLQGHINKNHLNTRPHICKICYKGFYNKSNLNEHVKTHNNQRNQVCEHCGCSFLHKKSLIEHLRLHSDIRPYTCHLCQKSFVTSGRRSDHIKRSHMEKAECCSICSKKYSLKKELTRHMNNVHLRSM